VNRGVSQLNKAIEAAGGNQSRVARDLEVDQSYLNRVAREDRTPGLEFMKKCKEKLGISLDSWEEDEPPATERAS
jgi:ribosome-binding protein aMBF1 (putative translation factor)